MSQVKISADPKISKNDQGEVKICHSLPWGDDKTWELEFSFDGTQNLLTEEPEPWLALALLPAMSCGLDLEITQPVSARLLQNLPTIQAIFNTWDASYRKIKINAPAKSAPVYGGERKTGCFFSGGVDSFYTILNHLDEIDVLIHLDNPWAGEAGRARMNGKIAEAAHRLGKPLILVKSNFRGLLDSYTHWNFSHGPAIISLALFLTPLLSKIFIASGVNYANLVPFGSHPVLDPLWSTEDLEVTHDGSEANRRQKIQAMAQNEIMLSSLRVCWENIENELNCGRCRKCLNTMVCLRTAGVLDRCTAFAVPLDLDALSQPLFIGLSSRLTMLDNLQVLEERQDDPELEAALRRGLAAQELLPPFDRLVGTDPEVVELRRKAAYYDQALRFQFVEKVNGLLSKNRTVHRVGEALVHRVWKLMK